MYDGKVLIDGGVVDRVPAGAVRNMGADIVIGVDVGFRTGEEFRPRNIFYINSNSRNYGSASCQKKN
jgi:NTE family protein